MVGRRIDLGQFLEKKLAVPVNLSKASPEGLIQALCSQGRWCIGCHILCWEWHGVDGWSGVAYHRVSVFE